jgi:hypothetical protein
MSTRFVVAGLYFFGLAAGVAIVVALLAPIDAIRFLGVVALACAGTGFLVELYALQRLDPQAFVEFRARFQASFHRVRAFASRTASTYTGATHSSSSRSVW